MRIPVFSLCIGFILMTGNVDAKKIDSDEYKNIKQHLIQGWNTWSTFSMAQHVLLPSGATINLGLLKRSKNKDGFVDRFFVNKTADGWNEPVVKPGYHSYTGDYTQLEIEYRDVHLRIETASEGSDIFILITPLKLDEQYPLLVIIEAGLCWNQIGQAYRHKNTLNIALPESEIQFYPSTVPVDELFVNTISPFMALKLDQSIGMSTISGDIELINNKVRKKRKEYELYISRYDDLRDVYAAMSSCLAWNTIYDVKNDRVFTTVDRQWNVNRGGYVFFGWDNFFMAQMIGLDNKELAMANAIEALNEATEEGFVSNNSQGNGRKSWDRSQPPVGGMMCWEIYEKHGDHWFLEDVYPKLLEWNEWWLKKRMNGKLLSWGSHVSKNPFHDQNYHNLQAAMLETGIDDSPMYEGVVFNKEKSMMELHDVGLNALYIGDCEALAKMAEVLGKNQEYRQLKERSKMFRENINSLWNEENGLFQNNDLIKQKFSSRISPTSFYPMISQTATYQQARMMIDRHLMNKNEFWGDWVLPSISKDDPQYEQQRYWKGAIWAPMNFLTYLGLRHYDQQAATELVLKSVEVFRKNWNKHGYVCENYSPLDGTCTHEKLKSSPWYTWGGLMVIMGLMHQGYYNSR